MTGTIGRVRTTIIRAVKIARLLLLSLLVACAGQMPVPNPAPAARAATPSAVHIVIVGTTDVHGWFAGHDDKQSHTGGLALFASYVQALRAANPGHVVLVDSGDMFQGTLESNLFEGEAVVKGYNLLGYSAAAIGNHEFDYGPVGPDPVARTADEDPLGALKKNAAAARFPFLSANLTEVATGATPEWARRTTIVDAGGARVGIIGLSTPDTPNVTTPQNVKSLRFGDPVLSAVAAAKELRAAGADAVIVIAHMGGRCTDLKDVLDAASCDGDQEAMRFLNRIPAGLIDGYFAGHTHSQMRQFIAAVPVLQALPYSREFSTLDMWVDPAAHRVVRSDIRPHTMICLSVFAGTETCDPRQAPKDAALVPRTFEGQTIAADQAMTALFAPYLEKVSIKRNEPLGLHVTATLTSAYSKESTLGDLLADALREGMAADIGLVNSGGLRAPMRAGDLVYGDMFEISPFDNFPAIVTMTGDQVAELLRRTSTGDRGIMQVSGIRYTVDVAKDSALPESSRNRLVDVTTEDGRSLEAVKLYKVAMPDFLAVGGEGLGKLMESIPKDRIVIHADLGPMREVFIAALQKRHQPITPVLQKRIVLLNEKPAVEH